MAGGDRAGVRQTQSLTVAASKRAVHAIIASMSDLAIGTTQLRAIADACRRFGVLRLEAFGSATSGAFRAGRSDFDFLVELDPQASGSRAQRLIDLAETLESLLGAPVDLVNPHYIRNPYFAAEIERTRVPVYERAPSEAAV